MRTYRRDRYQRSRVEYMVEQEFEEYLFDECNGQTRYVASLRKDALKNPEQKELLLKKAAEFELTRCEKLDELFPNRRRKRRSY